MTAQSQPVIGRSAIMAVILGNALEFYDFTVYVFFALPIGRTFFPSQDATQSLLASLALFGAGYLMRPVGGALIGALADRKGRKPAMLLTLTLMASGMLVIALTPGYAAWGTASHVLIIAGRLLQGLALGGEVGPSTAYLLETAQPGKRARAASWQIASQGCAALFSGLLAMALTWGLGTAAMEDWGWRVMFLLGVLIVPVGIYIRARLPESLHDARPQDTTRRTLLRLVREHGRLAVLMFVIIAASTVSNAVGTNMPVYARTVLGLNARVSAAAPTALGLASVLLPLLGGWLADRVGRKPILIWPRVAIAVLALPIFWLLIRHPSAWGVYGATFLLSALSSLNAAAIIVALPEALPLHVRSTGLSVIYALSVSLFGGSTNYVINKLVAVTGDPLAPAYYLLAFSIAGVWAASHMPETIETAL